MARIAWPPPESGMNLDHPSHQHLHINRPNIYMSDRISIQRWQTMPHWATKLVSVALNRNNRICAAVVTRPWNEVVEGAVNGFVEG